MSTKAIRFVFLLSLAVIGVSCADIAARMRRHTYPPGFQYITQQQLESSMWQLAHAVRGLREALREQPVDSQRRAEVIDMLRMMDLATRDLDSHGWPSNHPLVDANLAALRADIAQARRAVEWNPPNYVLAGSVSGACLYCHSGR